MKIKSLGAPIDAPNDNLYIFFYPTSLSPSCR